MKLTVENTTTMVSGISEDDEAWLREQLTFHPDSYTPKPKPIRMYKRKRIPSGLVPRMFRLAKDRGLEVEVEDLRVVPGEVPDPADVAAEILARWGQGGPLDWLRDYQKEALERAQIRRRGILAMPTGSGKSECIIGLTRIFPVPWLLLAHTVHLTEQAADRFVLRGATEDEPVARWEDQPGDDPPILTVATFQMLWSRMKKDRKGTMDRLARYRGLVIDEVHCLPAESFYSVAMACKGAYYRFGLSGTPGRGYKSDILSEAAIGPVIYKLATAKLVALGHLSQPTFRLIRCHQEGEFGRWQTAYRNLVVKSKVRNKLIVGAVLAAKKSCLVFVKETEHGRTLKDLIERAGMSADFAEGSWPVARRQRAAEQLNRGDLDVLITTKIFQEGVDIPYLMSVVNAGGGQSVVAVLQQQGRAMRAAAGKSTCEVWDVEDTGQKWLRAHARKREKIYTGQGFAMSYWSSQLVLPTAAVAG